AIQGFSAACLIPATISLINTYYHDKERHKALSMWSIGSYGGTGLSSVFAGLIATYIGWQWIFIASIVVTLIVLLMITDVLEAYANHSNTTLFACWRLLLVVISKFRIYIVISQGGDIGSDNPTILILLRVSGRTLPRCYFCEKRTRAPLIDFSRLSSPYFIGT